MEQSTSTITGDFGELRIETEVIDVTSNLPRPDPRWTYTDERGHEHRNGVDGGYPSLTLVVDRTYWCDDCNDEHEESHLECSICGEHIEPGTVGPTGYREFTPGRRAYYLNDEPISEERFQELAAQYGRQS